MSRCINHSVTAVPRLAALALIVCEGAVQLARTQGVAAAVRAGAGGATGAHGRHDAGTGGCGMSGTDGMTRG